jgi:lysophospholipase L1-like esterase
MPQPKHQDDNLMERFDESGARRFTARDALIAVGIAAVILVACAGASIRKAGLEEGNRLARASVLAVGTPAAWIASHLPAHAGASYLTAWLSPDASLSGPGGFSAPVGVGSASGVPLVTPDSFSPSDLGVPPPARQALHSLLVTGDSMSEPLDQDLARSLEPHGVKVTQDPHIGSGISSNLVVDWGKLSHSQVRQYRPNAVVVFIGANDGFPMLGPGRQQVACCGVAWATIYANRVRQIMNTFRQGGRAHVYWMLLPTPRDSRRAKIAAVVNASVSVAAEPWRDQVTVVDTVPTFTPGHVYRDSMTINGQPTIVRQSDGIHLNDAGSSLLSTIVLGTIKQNFTF